MIKSIPFLTWALLNTHGNRKKPGRIAIFIDTRNGSIYAVPRNEEHIDFAKRIAPQEAYSKIIPAYIDTQTVEGIEQVTAIETGYSGLELKGGVRHTKTDMKKAHSIAHKFVNAGEIPINSSLDSRITYEFAC